MRHSNINGNRHIYSFDLLSNIVLASTQLLKTELNFKKIFVFWFPLSLSWLMMAVEGPYVAAIIARLADAKYNLAAHGVAFSFALIFEAPIISITAATTALCKDKYSYRKLQRFVTALNLAITGFMLFMLIPPVFSFMMLDLIGLPQNVTDLIHVALMLLLPWPAAIGFRRFYQGVLITRGLTRRITYGTIVRLSTMGTTALILFQFDLNGAYTGAAALSMGVLAELIAVAMMAHSSINLLKNQDPANVEKSKELSYSYIFRFYYPLAAMTILSLGVHPMVTFFMGKSRFPIESLAVLPVLNSLVFIFRAIGLSYQEAVIALIKDSRRNLDKLFQFALLVGMCLVVILSLIAYTPLSTIWFHHISGLTLHLSEFAKLPLKILALMPGLSIIITFQWGVLVNSGKTKYISIATLIEVVVIVLGLFILTGFLNVIGVTAAAIVFVVGRSFGNVYLLPKTRKQVAKLI